MFALLAKLAATRARLVVLVGAALFLLRRRSPATSR